MSRDARPLHIVLLDYRDITHPLAGGAERYLNEMFQRIASHGHRVTLLCGRYPGAPREDHIGHFRIMRVGNMATMNFAAARAALSLARREHVDLFVENICKIPFFMPSLTKIPVLPIVHHLMGAAVFLETNPAFAAYVWLYEQLLPYLYRNVRFVAVSESTAQDLARRGLERRLTWVVENGLSLAHFPRARELEKAGEPLLVYCGMLKRYKGLDVALRALARTRRRVPAARLVLLGKGNDRARLERLAGTLGIGDAVVFAGWVSEQDKLAWLRKASVLLYPSVKEGWGISTLEAAACGTPTIASDVPGLRDAIRNEETGFLVPHAADEAWAERITQVLADDFLRMRLGAAAITWAERFDWEPLSRRMLAIVESVAGGLA